MKRILLIVFLCLIVVGVQARTYKNKTFTLYDCDVEIDKDAMKKLWILAPMFSQDEEAWPMIKKIQTICYYYFQDYMMQEKSLDILPVQSLSKKVGYDIYGFPDTKWKNALKYGNSKYFFTFNLEIEDAMEDMDIVMAADTILPEDQWLEYIIPKLTLTFSIYDKHGMIPIDKFESTIQAETVCRVNEQLLNGIANDNEEFSECDLMYYLDKAVVAVGENIKR